MTMTHSEGVLRHLSETWPYGLERWGHDPGEKDSVKLLNLARLARMTFDTLWETVVIVLKKGQTGLCYDNFDRIQRFILLVTSRGTEKENNQGKVWRTLPILRV